MRAMRQLAGDRKKRKPDTRDGGRGQKKAARTAGRLGDHASMRVTACYGEYVIVRAPATPVMVIVTPCV